MSKALFSRHCMQCKDGCQGSCGEAVQPRRQEISLPRFGASPARLWLCAVDSGCRVLEKPPGQSGAAVGICPRELLGQDQTVAQKAPPRWSKKPWKLLHQPAEPLPLPDIHPGCNRLQGGRKRGGSLELLSRLYCRNLTHGRQPFGWTELGQPTRRLKKVGMKDPPHAGIQPKG
jgi:hypothetical protein